MTSFKSVACSRRRRSLQASFVRVSGAILASVLVVSCTSSSNEPSLPNGLADLPFLQGDWSDAHGGARPGTLKEVERERLTGVNTEKMDLLPRVEEDDDPEDLSGEDIPSMGALTGQIAFEFFDITRLTITFFNSL